MTPRRNARSVLAAVLVLSLVAGIVVVLRIVGAANRTHVTAYFSNSNGIFAGDEIRILGVPVGRIETIRPQPERAEISFWIDDKYKVPADVNAVVLSPSLVTSRAIQLTPAYTGGPTLHDHSTIPQQRTAVPVEWDDFREQLERLTDTLQPTEPGGVSTLGALISTGADNLRGQGGDIRKTVVELAQTFSALGDHSQDLFGTFKNLSILVHALHDSAGLMRHLNQNLAAVTLLLADDPNEVGQAMTDINMVAGDVKDFVSGNRESLGLASDTLASVTTALAQSADDIKQTLHIAPTTFANFVNIYQPAQGALTGALALNNFANPISFLCGAIQAAARLGAEQSAKLCVQYLAPIIKNRQYNFPPLGFNPVVGTMARPNEITYSEDWLRPDHVPPAAPSPAGIAPAHESGSPLTPAGPSAVVPSQPSSTDPAAGLPGLMVPPGRHP